MEIPNLDNCTIDDLRRFITSSQEWMVEARKAEERPATFLDVYWARLYACLRNEAYKLRMRGQVDLATQREAQADIAYSKISEANKW